jgi:hypothetical protein
MVRFFCRFRKKLSTKLALAILITIFLLSLFILHCRTNVNRDADMDIYDENQSLLRTLNTYRMLFLLKLNTEAILKSDINTDLITVADNKEISNQHVNQLLDWLKKTGKDQNLDRSDEVNLKNINQHRDYLFNRKSFLKDFYNLSKTI